MLLLNTQELYTFWNHYKVSLDASNIIILKYSSLCRITRSYHSLLENWEKFRLRFYSLKYEVFFISEGTTITKVGQQALHSEMRAGRNPGADVISKLSHDYNKQSYQIKQLLIKQQTRLITTINRFTEYTDYLLLRYSKK